MWSFFSYGIEGNAGVIKYHGATLSSLSLWQNLDSIKSHQLRNQITGTIWWARKTLAIMLNWSTSDKTNWLRVTKPPTLNADTNSRQIAGGNSSSFTIGAVIIFVIVSTSKWQFASCNRESNQSVKETTCWSSLVIVLLTRAKNKIKINPHLPRRPRKPNEGQSSWHTVKNHSFPFWVSVRLFSTAKGKFFDGVRRFGNAVDRDGAGPWPLSEKKKKVQKPLEPTSLQGTEETYHCASLGRACRPRNCRHLTIAAKRWCPSSSGQILTENAYLVGRAML